MGGGSWAAPKGRMCGPLCLCQSLGIRRKPGACATVRWVSACIEEEVHVDVHLKSVNANKCVFLNVSLT